LRSARQRWPTSWPELTGIWFNDHIESHGPTVFKHACKLGLEGIVSKRKDSPYRSGLRALRCTDHVIVFNKEHLRRSA
jgi:hypothetical protein